MKAAVSSSRPMPMAKGLKASAVVRRPEAVALAEVLVDDEAVGQPEPGREADAAAARRAALVAECDHVLAQDRGAGAGAGHRNAARVAAADEARHGGAADHGGDAQLVAAGEEQAAGLLDALQAVALLAIATGVEVDGRDPAGAEFAEDALVTRPGIGQPAGGGDHHDVGLVAAAQFDEAAQDARVVLLFLRPADRNDPAALIAVGHFAWAHFFGHPDLAVGLRLPILRK
jgi:hypothetical protein